MVLSEDMIVEEEKEYANSTLQTEEDNQTKPQTNKNSLLLE